MRLFLLPINSRNTLIYAQRLNKQLTSEQSRIEKLTVKAGERWVLWESYEKGWQKKVTVWGNQLFARIPYQEWGLKSIPPLSARRKEEELKGNEAVELLFPAKTLPAEKVPDTLRRLATERQAFHRQRMIWTVIGMPFTIPFALLPVIPNLPFFYMAFRAWSHWKALAGSRHVQYLLDNKLLKYSESSILQKVYDLGELPQESVKPLKDSLAKIEDLAERSRTFTKAIEAETLATVASNSPNPANPDALLVTKSTGQLVSLCFGIPQVDTELERAAQQVNRQIHAENTSATVQEDQKANGKKS